MVATSRTAALRADVPLTSGDGATAAGAVRPGLAPAPQAAWTSSAQNPLVSGASPRLLETILGAGLILETVPGLALPIPVAELFMILLLVLAAFRPPRRDLSRFGLLGLVGVALLGFLVAETLYNGVDPTRRAVRIGLLMAFIASIASERLDVKGLLWGMAGAGLVNVPLYYAGLAPDSYHPHLTGFLGDKNVSGLFYALIVPMLIATVQRPRTKAAIVVLGVALTFLTGSRTSLAGLLCAIAWMMVSPYLGRVLRLVLLAGTAYTVNWAETNLASLKVFGDRTGTDWFRAQIQAAAAEKSATAPWYGDGLSTATVDLPQGTFFYHNSYLGLIVEGGIVFLLVVVAAYVLLGLRPFALTRRSPSRVAVEAATLIILVTSQQLGEVFITVFGAIILGVGLLLAVHEREQAEAAAPVSRRSARIVEQARRDRLRGLA